jgi:hypothetical protein
VDRLSGELAKQIPQRGVHAAQRPEQERTEELVLAPQAVVDQGLKVPGVAAQEERGHHRMEDLNRLLGMEGCRLTDAFGTVVGPDPDDSHLSLQEAFDALHPHRTTPLSLRFPRLGR